MSSKIKRKGTNKERELREKLFKKGILSFRVAGSGSTRKIPALDLIVVYKNKAYGIEVKTMSKLKNVYLREEQLFKLLTISEYIEVWIAIYQRNIGWKFVKFKPLRVIPKDIIKKSMDLDQFVEYVKSKKIDSI